MIRVIQTAHVARSLQRLRARPAHPFFAGYLHLQRRAAELNRLTDLEPDFTRFHQRFFLVKDHPIGTPYVKPFVNHVASEKNLWLNENVAGSYAPSSLRPNQPFRKIVIVNDGAYSLHPDHAKRALKYLLNNRRVSIADLSVFLYRDFGLLSKVNAIDDLIACFAADFGYSSKLTIPSDGSFKTLFELDRADTWPAEWLDPWETGADVNPGVGAKRVDLPLTAEAVRTLGADELLGSRAQSAAFRHLGPALKELRVKGLLSFGNDVTFMFGQLNVLVGPNGSGKSNLLDCLRLLREAPTDIQTTLARGGFETWLFNGLDKKHGTGELQVIANVPELAVAIRHQVRLGPSSLSGVLLEELVDSEHVDAARTAPFFVGSYRSPAVLSVPGSYKRRHTKQLGPQEYNSHQSILSQLRDIGQYPEVTRLARLYAGFRIYSEWSFGRESELRKAASPTRSDSQLSEQMTDLPSTLNALLETPTHERIRELLPELKKSYRDFVTRIMWGQVGLELIEAPFELPVPADRLSDGTLRFLALAVILLHPDPAPVICLEEPELGMHPDMIRMVANMIKEASAKAQVIVTTHSEHLLTALQDDFDVLFAFDGTSTGTAVQRLTRDQFREWRAAHSLGDLWSSGELGGVRY